MIKKIDKKRDSFLFIIMKLNKSLNQNIFYSFGDKTDSLSLLKEGKRQILLGNKIIPHDRLVMAEQTHSTDIKIITDEDLGAGFANNKAEVSHVDGFITDKCNVFIVIKAADCSPILVYAKEKNLIGGCHSGRQGSKNGIVKVLVETMIKDYDVLASDLVVMIGPAISGPNYQVSPEIYSDFLRITKLDQEYRHIDMQKVIIRDLVQSGVLANNIIASNVCTYENTSYNSYRRDKTAERQIAIIGIVDGKIH